MSIAGRCHRTVHAVQPPLDLLHDSRKVWETAFAEPNNAQAKSDRIRVALLGSDSHEAFAWGALTCGWIASKRGSSDEAESCLTQALGRFLLTGNSYGSALCISALAITQVQRRDLDRALALVLKPFATGTAFSLQDRFSLHNNADLCYWAREEVHDAILHSLNSRSPAATSCVRDGLKVAPVDGDHTELRLYGTDGLRH